MRVKKILASVMAMATLAGTLVVPASAAVVNLKAKGTRLPTTWSVSYTDSSPNWTYYRDNKDLATHKVRVWNDQTGKRAESKKVCGKTATATVSCKPSTPNSKLTTIVELDYRGLQGYSKNGVLYNYYSHRSEGHAGSNVTTYFYL